MNRKENGSNPNGFMDFLHTKTGMGLLALTALVWVGNCYSKMDTNPNNFPDLERRFRVEKNMDPDGIYRLAVYRTNGSAINWWDNDLVAFERDITQECGELAKFQGSNDTYGPVNFRIMREEIPWSCTWVR